MSSCQEVLQAAQAASREARHEDVLELCESCLPEFRAEGPASADSYSEAQFLRADSLRHLGRWNDAATAFAEVTTIREPATASRRAARAFRLLAEIDRRSRRYEEALNSAGSAVALSEEAGDTVGVALSRVCLARGLSDMGNSSEAQDVIVDVLEQVEKHLDDRPEVWAQVALAARTALSLVQFRRDDLPEAMRVLDEIRDVVEFVPHAITRAAYYRQAAILFELTRRYSSAIRNLNMALVLYDRVRFEPGRYDVYWSMALSYTDLGDLRTAQLCLEQCIDIAQRLNLRLELGKSKSSFAELAVREGRYDEAMALFREDLELSQGLGDEQALGHCNRKLAYCCRLMGDLPRAGDHARASVRHFEATGREGEANASRVLLGGILVESNDTAAASAVLAEAEAKLSPRARAAERAELLRTKGLVARALGDLAGAATLLHESLALQDRRAPSRVLADTQLALGATARDLGNLNEAKQHLSAAIEVAGVLGSRDLWARALEELRQIDVMAAMRLMLKPYLPNRAVEELSGGGEPGGVHAASVMFVDLRSSTAISGHLSALEMSVVLDAFLGPVVRIILRHGGTVDKFIGDCVVAVFGLGGEDDQDGAQAAVEAGLEIIEYMEATREVRHRSGAAVLEAAIGVNTGEVVSGCFGPLLRRDYTVLGYHVNLAQRLQSLAGAVVSDQGTRMVISGTTRAAMVQPVDAELLDLRSTPLKGIETVEAWLVRAP